MQRQFVPGRPGTGRRGHSGTGRRGASRRGRLGHPRLRGRALLATAALLAATTTAAPAAGPDSLFHIDRNKNRNQVHYGIHVDAGTCRPEGDEPVYNYWLRLERDPPATEPLRFFQQVAYGFRDQSVEEDGRVEIDLRALPDRRLVVRVARVDGACKAETFLTINGQQAYLDKVFVFAEEGFFLPTVRYIELFGRTNDGLAAYEKIVVDD